VVRALDLRLRRSRVRLRASRFQVTAVEKLLTHVCRCHQAVQFGTGEGTVMPCGWEGNRRSGVALAMRHRLQWFIHLWAQGLRKGDEHPAYTPHGVWHTLLLLCSLLLLTLSVSWFVCVSVCVRVCVCVLLLHALVNPAKRLKRSRCRLVGRLMWARTCPIEPYFRWEYTLVHLINTNDMCVSGNAGCRYRYCSNLLSISSPLLL